MFEHLRDMLLKRKSNRNYCYIKQNKEGEEEEEKKK